MKIFAIHRDGELCDSISPYHAKTLYDAEIEFTADYCETPEQMGVELVEYAPVGHTASEFHEAAIALNLTAMYLANRKPLDSKGKLLLRRVRAVHDMMMGVPTESEKDHD